jgi:hypothetical protein
MTAEIAIINRHGAAIASDSAVTASFGDDKYKVYHSSQKIIRLNNSVGIMFYHNAAFMGIDIDLIIKEYRKSLREKTFDKLFDYYDDFIKFLKNYRHFQEEEQISFLESLSYEISSRIKELFFNKILEKFGYDENTAITDKHLEEIEELFYKNAEDILNNMSREVEVSKLFSVDGKFIQKHKETIYAVFDNVFENYKLDGGKRETLIRLLPEYINRVIINDFCGIVITGFGEDEIYPSLINFRLYAKLGDSLIYALELSEEGGSVDIIPFAQIDVVHTFLKGVSPELHNTFIEQFNTVIDKLSPYLADQKALPEIKQELAASIEKFQKQFYIDPLLEITARLGKKELAEMAEALVNITAIKRQLSEITETVGGSTDVAVITKGDGFRWIKRKHYYDYEKQPN